MSKYEFKLPDIGEGVTEGEIVGWLVAEGDSVGEDQDMVEVMTDKATVTIGAPKAGKVVELRGAVGDVIPGKASLPGMRVEVLDPERALVTRSEDGTWVWAFALDELDGRTRLLSRNRVAMPDPSLGDRIGMAVMEPGSLVMERKMLRGIKERAERLVAEPELAASA